MLKTSRLRLMLGVAVWLLAVGCAAAGFSEGRSAKLVGELEELGLSAKAIKVFHVHCLRKMNRTPRCSDEKGKKKRCRSAGSRAALNSFARGRRAQLEATAMAEWIVTVRRNLHKSPELMYDLTDTAAIVRGVLDELKIPYQYPIASHGIVATIGSGKQPVIALRSGALACARGSRRSKMRACACGSCGCVLVRAGMTRDNHSVRSPSHSPTRPTIDSCSLPPCQRPPCVHQTWTPCR